jgi:tRNA A-37 threonylcarbamoyl transferase component Bud32
MLGNYRIVREIGRGATAVVYEAEHCPLGCRVAIKVLRAELLGNPRAEARLAREARLAASLAHPHVARVYDICRADGAVFLAMELADQGTLAAHVGHQAMPLSRIIELFLPILSATAHAHERGVVHRDLKPANVLLAIDRFGDLVPKVTDFGVGKAPWMDGERLTEDGRLIGTLQYMAPEQARDAKSAEAAADQYALGVMLYEALTRRLPYSGESPVECIQAFIAGGAPPPSRIAEHLPREIDKVVMRAMQIEPSARFPSVKALGAALLPFAPQGAWATWARELRGEPATGNTVDDVRGGDMAVAAAEAVEGARPRPPRRIPWLVPLALGAACGVGAMAASSPTQTAGAPRAGCPDAPAAAAVAPTIDPLACPTVASPESTQTAQGAIHVERLEPKLRPRGLRPARAAGVAPAASTVPPAAAKIVPEPSGPNHAPIIE